MVERRDESRGQRWRRPRPPRAAVPPLAAALLGACSLSLSHRQAPGLPDTDGDGHFPVTVGGTDCDDADATVYAGAPEICDDGIDQDCDGIVDCDDAYCADDPSCVEHCDDGVDDNRNGLVDCDDPRCSDDEACPEDCDNGIDDDADGLVDCEDGECARDEACHPYAFRVSLRDLAGTYRVGNIISTVYDCELTFRSVAGTVTDLLGDRTCTFTGGRLHWAGTGLDDCSWGDDLGTMSDRWYRDPAVSGACDLGTTWLHVPLSAVRRPDRTGGIYRGWLHLYRRHAPILAATASIDLTASFITRTGRYSTYTARNYAFRLAAPLTWAIPYGYPIGP